eukprot:gnl/MRDRNA2_/MRDRNA2_82899_c0_seq1.p1 gnl/MRDRNA2_/MRDRNA2_82899_c0~~gnl/MRDRNA2_/MRDRNA2_82899_c0_seq1.p1  ORF type:complete len:513 (-),score=64.33 gnl/MRDRNA2_/MRDRNA2_82899_c0_seq1:160-1698(-)
MALISSLRFSVVQKENDFAKSRMPALVKSLQLGAAILCFLMPVNAAFAVIGGNMSGPHSSPTLFMLGVDAAAFLIYLGLFVYLRTPLIETKKSPAHLERVAIAMFLLAILLSCTTDGFRTARLFGVDPEAAWNRNMCQFTDSTYALRLDGIVTAVGVFVPVRAHILPVIPTTAAVSFVLTSTLLGTSETFSQVASNTLLLSVIGYILCVGCRMTEARERVHFSETIEAQQQMVTEKVARFDLEHQIERTSLSTQGQGMVEVKEGVGGLIPKTLGRAEDDLTSGTLDLSSLSSKPGGGTSVLDLSSKSSKPSTIVWPISPRKDVGTDPVYAEVEDKATDPLLVWNEAGWKCQRCSKPPLPPMDEALRRQNSKHSSCSSSRTDPQARKRKQKLPHSGASDGGASAESLDGPPQLSCFELTPRATAQHIMRDILQTFNCKRGIPGICCPYHNTVSYVQKATRVLQKEPCEPLWSPFTQDQCPFCFSMLDFRMEPGLSCEVCGFQMHELAPQIKSL